MVREKLAEPLVVKCTSLSIDEVRALAVTL